MMHIDEDSAESMRALRSRSNDRVPVSRLPDEILLMIFNHIEEEKRLNGFDSDDDDIDGIGDAPACLAVTHACRYWRKVALECPTLWTLIRCTPPLWLDVMLERSQNAPLVVSYSAFSISLLEGCLDKVLLHLPRIKHLELRVFEIDIGRTTRTPVMDLLSSQPAPMLEKFKFFLYSTSSLPTTVSTSNTIFQGQAPLLQHLDGFIGNRIWSSCIFGGIRTLRVATVPPLPDLLSTLRCMPTLEQLMLVSGLSRSAQLILSNKVPLPRLKSIALSAISLQDAVSILAHLALPIDVKISLRLSPITGPRTFADLFSVMGEHPGESGPVFRSLRVIKPNPNGLAVQFSTSTTINSDYSWNPQDDDIRLSIEFYNQNREVYPYTFGEIPRDTTINICQMIAQRRPQTFFSGEFESIQVQGCSDFIEGLTAALRIEGSSNVTYPSLRVLELQDILFDDDELSLQDLLDVFIMRAQHNVTFHDLRLRLCKYFTADRMQLFHEVVVNDIDCDQYTLEHSEACQTWFQSFQSLFPY
ncbi:hypothetical protein EV702DRAFT_1250990 [Suillus placidus]|uniref:F-box domain-containing protein n=1 Tax=Suillus placidus TaxID=48579 RepID=A0A9P6ZKP5_9AGAM|nr:hypothetical protein EV702DRAFT_1250990 [Suillus placidus]